MRYPTSHLVYHDFVNGTACLIALQYLIADIEGDDGIQEVEMLKSRSWIIFAPASHQATNPLGWLAPELAPKVLDPAKLNSTMRGGA